MMRLPIGCGVRISGIGVAASTWQRWRHRARLGRAGPAGPNQRAGRARLGRAGPNHCKFSERSEEGGCRGSLVEGAAPPPLPQVLSWPPRQSVGLCANLRRFYAQHFKSTRARYAQCTPSAQRAQRGQVGRAEGGPRWWVEDGVGWGGGRVWLRGGARIQPLPVLRIGRPHLAPAAPRRRPRSVVRNARRRGRPQREEAIGHRQGAGRDSE